MSSMYAKEVGVSEKCVSNDYSPGIVADTGEKSAKRK